MIDARLLDAYITELDALRTHGREFAEAYPDIAARLDIGARVSRDAHVERVVESAAFLAARLRLMLETQANELPLNMLSMLAPALVEPIPSMAIAELVEGSGLQSIPRGTRFDASIGGRPVCFRTTMPITVAPVQIVSEVVGPGSYFASGIDLHFSGLPAPDPLVLYLGTDSRSAAVLMDAIDEHLVSLSVVRPDGTRFAVPHHRVISIGWLAADHAALPTRPAIHPAHRLVSEFLVFPEKFRFITVSGVELLPDSVLEFRFNAPLALNPPVPRNLIGVNHVAAINLWSADGAPIDIDGRLIEYPVTVDTVRYRTVECHSVERVDLFAAGASAAEPIDPIVAMGKIGGSKVRWGVRRTPWRGGGGVSLYFDGVDYGTLGRQRMLAVPKVLATNRDMARYLQAGAPLFPQEGLGTWRGRLVAPPSAPFNPGLNEQAMMTLVGFLRSSISGLIADAHTGALQEFLRSFPGGAQAAWINSLGGASLEPITVLRHGQPQAGVSVRIQYDAGSQVTTSRAALRRVLGQLFASQRGINRVEEVRLDAA